METPIVRRFRLNRQIHLMNRLMHIVHVEDARRLRGSGVIPSRAMQPVGFAEGFWRAGSGAASACKSLTAEPRYTRFFTKNPAVTWCYNPSGGITFFGSTRRMAAHKLLLTGHWEVVRPGVASPACPTLKPGSADARTVNLRRVVEQVKDRERRVFERIARVAGRTACAHGCVRLCETFVCPARQLAARQRSQRRVLPAGAAECAGRSLVRPAIRDTREPGRPQSGCGSSPGAGVQRFDAPCRTGSSVPCRRRAGPLRGVDHAGERRRSPGAASSRQLRCCAHRIDSRRRRPL